MAGQHIDAAEWGWAFRIVCGLARFAGQTIELPTTVPAAAAQALVVDARRRALAQPGRQLGYRTKPRTALLATALLAFAGPVLAAGSDGELRQALSPFGAAVAAGLGAQACEPLWRWRMPPFLRLALRSVFPTPKASWGWVSAHVPPPAGLDRSAARTPRPRRTAAASNRPGAGGSLEFRHLPHLVAAEDYQELIAPWLRTPAGLTGRRFTALALARLCGASSWADAGIALGWADGRAPAVAEYACEFVIDPQNFWLAITSLADRLQQRGPVDYARRQRTLATLTSIDIQTWRPVFAEHGLRLMPATCRAAAVWVWAALTCGELTDAPALADPGWSRVSTKSRLRTCRDLSDRMPPGLAAKLLAFGRALLDSPVGR